jgi:hypothetical protein
VPGWLSLDDEEGPYSLEWTTSQRWNPRHNVPRNSLDFSPSSDPFSTQHDGSGDARDMSSSDTRSGPWRIADAAGLEYPRAVVHAVSRTTQDSDTHADARRKCNEEVEEEEEEKRRHVDEVDGGWSGECDS